MYSTRAHNEAMDAAADMLRVPRPGAFRFVVSGRCSDLPVKFRLSDWGWRVTVGDAPTHVAFDVRDATPASNDAASIVDDPEFRVGYIVDGAPAETVRMALSADLCRRIADLEPAHVEVTKGTLSVWKNYSWRTGSRDEVHAGIQLAVDLVHALRSAPVPEPRIEPHTGGSPYRGAFAYTDPAEALRAELAAYMVRLRRRRRRRLVRRVGWAAAIGALFAAWPIGVVVWAMHVRRRDQRRDRRLAAAARAQLPPPPD